MRRPASGWTAAAMAGLLFVGACGFLPESLPEPSCEQGGFVGPPTLSCEAAVAGAVDSLVSHPTIAALQFTYGGICPPNARCLAPNGDSGIVIVSFADGSQVSVYVSLATGVLVVERPQPYPPPGRAG